VDELTAVGRGAVSVLRVAGAAGRAAFARLSGPRAAAALGDGVPRVVRLGVAGDLLDVALALERGAGDVELHVHGSPPLVAALARTLGGGPERRRRDRLSFEERALALLADARSDAAARMLLDQAEGALRRELARLVPAPPERWRAVLAELAARQRVAARLVTPPRVVLAGPVNAGKSTLFNLLLGRRRVVESDEEGTTRDAIAEPCRLGAYAVELVDTAGERALPAGGAADRTAVEAAGQALARALRREADLVLWLDPGGAPPPEGAGAGVPVRVLAARGDRAGERKSGLDAPRLRPREEPLAARTAVEEAFHAALDLPREPWTPGAGVPLVATDAAGLAELAGAGSTAARWLGLRQVLGPAPLGGVRGEG
jgi:tRNA modification GTPase